MYRLVTLTAVVLTVSILALPAAAVPPTLSGPVLLPGDAGVVTAASNQETPVIAAGGSGYLAVWTDSRTNFISFSPSGEEQGGRDIYAARLDAAGNLLDTIPIVVNQEYGYQRNPRVSWNGQHWLVVWESQVVGTWYYASGILAARVAPDGTVLDDPPIPVHVYGNSSTANFDVASNGPDWLVVVQGSASGEGGILGVRVNGAGTVVDAPPAVLVPPTTYLYYNIAVHAARGEYLLTFTGSSTPEARRFAADLTPVGVPYNPPAGVIGSNGTDYYVAWNSYPTLGSPMAPDGTLLVPAGSTITPDGNYGIQVDWDGTRWRAAWRHPFDVRVLHARIAADGTVLDPGGIALSPTVTTGTALRVAGFAGGAQLVWQDNRAGGSLPYDVYGAHVDAAGIAGADAPLALGARSQVRSDAAAGPGGEFLTVYTSDTSGQRRLLAQRISGAGLALDPEPIVLAVGPNLSPPAVDWDGTRYLVVWADGTGIVGRRMNGDGTFVDPAEFPIMPGFSPDVAAMDGVFLVVGTHFTSTYHFLNPFAIRVDGATGTVLDPAPRFLGPYYAKYPRVARFGNRWFAVWERHWSHDEIQAELDMAFIEADGTVHGTDFPFVSSGFTPDVAVAGATAMIVFRTGSISSGDQDIHALRVNPDGTFPDGTPGFVVSDSPDRQSDPRIAWDGEQYCIVWEDKRSAAAFFDERTDLYAMRMTETGQILDVEGFPLATSPLPETRPTIASEGGNTVILAGLFQDQAPHAAYRLGVWRGDGVVGDPPQAAFTAANPTGCAPLAVSFTDASTGDVTAWLWDFGDGTTSTEQNPVHVYEQPTFFNQDPYTVTLSVSGPGGSGAFVRENLVVIPDLVTAGFTAAERTGCGPLTVTFTEHSTGNPTSWFWDFGDGQTSTEQHPVHVYQTTGTYTVTLVATGECGSDDMTRTDYVTVTGPCPLIALATGDQPVKGTVSGDYTLTHPDNYQFQTITEVESGGKPSNRHSLLEHRWPFDVPAGGAVTFVLHAYRGSTGDADAFAVEYSTDGSTFLPVTVLAAPGVTQQSFPMPAGVTGPVTIRVIDTDRTPGNLTLDTVSIDHMRFEVAVDEPPPPPPAIHVFDVAVSRVSTKGNKIQGKATVCIHDAAGDPVAGATVSGRFSGPTGGTAAGVTGIDGKIALLSSRTRPTTDTWCFTVENLSRPGAVHDPGADVETMDCEIGGVAAEALIGAELLSIEPGTVGRGPRIRFALGHSAEVGLAVFDVRGRLLHRVPAAFLSAGEHTLAWERPAASGVYFYRLRASGVELTGRLVVLH